METLQLPESLKEKDAAEIENAMLDDVPETHRFSEIVPVGKDVKMRQSANFKNQLVITFFAIILLSVILKSVID